MGDVVSALHLRDAELRAAPPDSERHQPPHRGDQRRRIRRWRFGDRLRPRPGRDVRGPARLVASHRSRVPDHRLPRDVRDRARRHDPEKVDRARGLVVYRERRADPGIVAAMIPVPRRAHAIPWRRRVASAFTDRLALKASAVLLAIVLWFVVAAREPREEYAPVQFTPRLDSTLVLRDPPPPIRAHVLGRPSEILKLATQPLVIRRPIASDAPDTLVLALRPGDVEVPLGTDVIVREVYPQSVTLRFESRSARRVPVRSSILARMSAGLQDIAVQLDPDSVTVLGPRGAVADIEFVRTVVDSIVVDTMPHLVDLDTTGLGATVRPTQVKARFVRRRQPSPPT